MSKEPSLMLLAVLLSATAYSGTPGDLTRKEALEPAGSPEVRAANLYASNDRSRLAEILAENNYTQQLYGKTLANFAHWVNELTVVYPALLDVESQRELAKRAKSREDMCPQSQATGTVLCWDQEWDEATGIYFRTMRPGITRVQPDTLVNIGDDSQLWVTSAHGHLAAGGHSENVPIKDYEWTEVLHCATPHEQGHDGLDGAWFYAAKGSGVSLNVGKTLVVSEWKLEREGISAPMQSAQLAMFWNEASSNITDYLGLSHGERTTFDTIQRVDHHEPGDQPAYHEIIVNPKHLLEHQHMYEANNGVIKCGQYPELHLCTRQHATEPQLTAVSRTCGASH